jgi:hypothetical protein
VVDNHLAGQRQKMRRRQRILENAAAISTSTDDASAQRTSSLESLNIIRNNVFGYYFLAPTGPPPASDFNATS